MDDALVKIQNLCQLNETNARANEIYRAVKLKTTGYGTGYDLGSSAIGLPAICAYVASNELQNNDVAFATAQAASCLKKSDFSRALQIVQSALIDTSNKRASRSSSTNAYAGLMSEYKVNFDSDRFRHWAAKLEQRLFLEDEQYRELETYAVPQIIFFWFFTETTDKPPRNMTLDSFLKRCGIKPKVGKETFAALKRTVSYLKDDIVEDRRRAKEGLPLAVPTTPTKTPSPRKSPQKRTLRELPTRDSPQKRKAESTTTPQGSPRKKLKAGMDFTAFNEALADVNVSPRKPPATQKLPPFPSTPSRRHKSPPPPVTPSPLRSKRHAAKPEEMQVDNALLVDSSDEEEEEVTFPAERKRFRPVFLGTSQWNSVDPRLDKIVQRAKKQYDERVKRYGHPFKEIRSRHSVSDSD